MLATHSRASNFIAPGAPTSLRLTAKETRKAPVQKRAASQSRQPPASLRQAHQRWGEYPWRCHRLRLAAVEKDCTRHTAASMLLAKTGAVEKTAFALGTSEGILRKHYMALVTKADAEKFWALAP